jgi:hypothetical protein
VPENDFTAIIANDYMTSSYLKNTINDAFTMHIKDRFRLQLDVEKTNILISACNIFPSVLHYILLGDNSPYIRNYEHREELRKSGQDSEELADSLYYVTFCCSYL